LELTFQRYRWECGCGYSSLIYILAHLDIIVVFEDHQYEKYKHLRIFTIRIEF
jgi:hypothetical protein